MALSLVQTLEEQGSAFSQPGDPVILIGEQTIGGYLNINSVMYGWMKVYRKRNGLGALMHSITKAQVNT